MLREIDRAEDRFGDLNSAASKLRNAARRAEGSPALVTAPLELEATLKPG